MLFFLAGMNTSSALMNNNSSFLFKISIAWYFFLMGTVLGNWAAIIPVVKDMHNINNGELGGIMVGVVFGAICVIPVVTKLIDKFGSKITVHIGGILLVLLFPIIGIPGNIGILITGMVMLGFSVGFLDISINGQAVLYEKYTSHPHLGLFTSIFAIGNMIGALSGGAMIGPLDLTVFYQCLILSGILLVPTLIFPLFLFPYSQEIEITKNTPISGADIHQQKDSSTTPLLNSSLEDGSTDDPKTLDVEENSQYPNLLYIVSALSFAAYFGEGSVGDWSAIYLSNHDASNFESSFGVAIFQLFLALGRFYSDYLVVSIGRVKLLKLSGLFASLGLVIVSISPIFLPSFNVFLGVSIFGFALSGVGLSVVYPTCISIAGSCIEGMPPADSIAFVSSIGYIGVMVGPPVLGGLSLLISLRYSFLVDAVLLASMTLLAFFLQTK